MHLPVDGFRVRAGLRCAKNETSVVSVLSFRILENSEQQLDSNRPVSKKSPQGEDSTRNLAETPVLCEGGYLFLPFRFGLSSRNVRQIYKKFLNIICLIISYHVFHYYFKTSKINKIIHKTKSQSKKRQNYS